MRPRRLGRYEVVGELGANAQGAVLDAVLLGPAGFRKPVALVPIPAPSGSTQGARIGGLFRHPHLIEVYAVEELEGAWYRVSERVSGGSLAGRRLSVRAAVELGLQLTSALGFLHHELRRAGHGLSPDLLLCDGPVVKVAEVAPTDADAAGRSEDVRALANTLRQLVAEASPELEAVLAACAQGTFAEARELADALASIPLTGDSLVEVLRTSGTRGADTEDLSLPRTNLAASDDLFLGRDHELAALSRQLAHPGLVTLWGPAGVGKTRLAREAAARFVADGGEAWFCDLSACLDEPALVIAVANALEVVLGSDDSNVISALRSRGPLVLVLDNLEQVVEPAGALVRRWSGELPDTRFLATSRVALGLEDEVLVQLGPLRPHAATDLLALRSRTPRTPALESLASRLDGIPLAIELAAARLGVMSPEQVLGRLDRRLRLLGGKRDALRGALDSSWELLDPAERDALAQCSVFQGPFSLEAADAVLSLGEGLWPLEVLERLVRHALVMARDGRLVLLESVRAYASEKLEDLEGVRARHATWFASLGRPERLGRLQTAWRLEPWAELAADLEELVSACVYCRDRGRHLEAAYAFVAVSEILERTGPLQRGLELADTLELDGLEDEAVAGVWISTHALARHAGELERSARLQSLTWERFSEHNDRNLRVVTWRMRAEDLVSKSPLEAIGLLRQILAFPDISMTASCAAELSLAIVLAEVGELSEALERCEAVVDRLQRAGGERHLAVARTSLAALYLEAGRPLDAHAQLSLTVRDVERHRDHRLLGRSFGNLGAVALYLGRLDEAEHHLLRSVDEFQLFGNASSTGFALAKLAEIALARGDVDAGREYLARAVALNEDSLDAGKLLARLGGLLLDVGELAGARSHYERARERLRTHHQQVELASAVSNLGTIALFEGDVGRAVDLLESAMDLASSVAHLQVQGFVHEKRGVLEGARGDLDAAVVQHEAALACFVAAQDVAGRGRATGRLALVECRLGRPEAALVRIEALLAEVEPAHVDAIELLGVARGEALGLLGRADEAHELLVAAVERLRDFPIDAVTAACALARARARAGDGDGAREALALAEDAAVPLGSAERAPHRVDLRRTREVLATRRPGPGSPPR